MGNHGEGIARVAATTAATTGLRLGLSARRRYKPDSVSRCGRCSAARVKPLSRSAKRRAGFADRIIDDSFSFGVRARPGTREMQ